MTSDTPRLRRDILIKAQQLAQDIDQVEDELELYRERDLPGFNAWFEERFAVERAMLTELECRLAIVSLRHNAIVALSNMHDLSLEHAQRMIAQEDAAFQNGNEATRERIATERAAREAFIRADLDREVTARLGSWTSPDAAAASVDPSASPTDDSAAGGSGGQLKTIYRRLVRRLHPDVLRTPECPTELRWQRRIWSLLQAAYARGDARTLGDLYRVTLLRQMEFNELTVLDARDAYAWLERELAALTAERDDARARPAWGFANVTSDDDLTARVREEFRADAASIRSEIEDIEAQFEYLSLLDAGGARRPSRVFDPRPRGPRRGRKADARPINQLSFFD